MITSSEPLFPPLLPPLPPPPPPPARSVYCLLLCRPVATPTLPVLTPPEYWQAYILSIHKVLLAGLSPPIHTYIHIKCVCAVYIASTSMADQIMYRQTDRQYNTLLLWDWIIQHLKRFGSGVCVNNADIKTDYPPHSKHNVCITKTNNLMLYKEITAVYLDMMQKLIHSMCRVSEECLEVTTRGAYLIIHTYVCMYIHIYIYIQGVTGGMCQTSGGCSLC
jgi:hypothetical protein